MNSPMLKPCPFCGGKAEIWRAHPENPPRKAWIACTGLCAVMTKEHITDEAAIAAWNTRRPDTPARPDREAVARVVERFIIRRLYKDRIDGYTLEMSLEIADALALLPPADGERRRIVHSWRGMARLVRGPAHAQHRRHGEP